jgi:hypothetical protein
LSKARYTERLSVGFTPDQVRRLEELARVRSRTGQPVSKADVIRAAVTFYFMHQDDLPGSRKAIARSVEGKIVEVDRKVDYLTDTLKAFIERVTKRRA